MNRATCGVLFWEHLKLKFLEKSAFDLAVLPDLCIVI